MDRVKDSSSSPCNDDIPINSTENTENGELVICLDDSVVSSVQGIETDNNDGHEDKKTQSREQNLWTLYTEEQTIKDNYKANDDDDDDDDDSETSIQVLDWDAPDLGSRKISPNKYDSDKDKANYSPPDLMRKANAAEQAESQKQKRRQAKRKTRRYRDNPRLTAFIARERGKMQGVFICTYCRAWRGFNVKNYRVHRRFFCKARKETERPASAFN